MLQRRTLREKSIHPLILRTSRFCDCWYPHRIWRAELTRLAYPSHATNAAAAAPRCFRENEAEEVKEDSPKEMSLDEWKAAQDKERAKVEFNIRKPNEGADWKKGYVLHKSKKEEVGSAMPVLSERHPGNWANSPTSNQVQWMEWPSVQCQIWIRGYLNSSASVFK